MTHVAVHIWGEQVDSGFLNSAENAIDELNSQVDFTVAGYVEDNDFDSNNENWDDIKDDFVEYVENKLGGAPHGWDCHLIIIDRADENFIGAGKAWGHTNDNGSQFSSGSASVAGVNAAVKLYVDSWCYGDGDDAYKNTVIHEVLHTLAKEDYYGTDYTYYPDPGNEHSLGKVYSDRRANPVSPLETWYADNNCGDNEPVDWDCSGSTDNRYRYVSDLSSCEVDAAEDYYDEVF